MHVWSTILGIAIVLTILRDAFETIVLPRRVQRGFRLTALFYRSTWRLWARGAQHIHKSSRRENFLGYFGPLSLIVLLGLWASSLIVGFAFVQHGLGQHLQTNGERITPGLILYHSGETFFTLGYGDVIPNNTAARVLSVMESGMGFAFLGVVIGYLPVVYSAFSTRESEISLLDARAGSPPSASEFLGRLGCCPEQSVLDDIFRDWERWCADLLITHISYPVLVFFRSQHSNQSWLSALTSMLDITSLVMTGVSGIHADQAKLTFAMARHAMVDLTQVIGAQYQPHDPDRLPPEQEQRLRNDLARRGVTLSNTAEAAAHLTELRVLYEPYAEALARRLYMPLPPWIRSEAKKDNWKGGPWDQAILARALERPGRAADDHF